MNTITEKNNDFFPKHIPFKNDENAPFKMIDLFCGIGGTRLGFQLTGQVKSMFSSEIFKAIKNTLEELGYKVYAKILSSKDFGVPQNRQRIYIVGFLPPFTAQR